MEEAYSDNTLDLYLSGELSDAEQEAFEKRLDMDESLQKELEVALKAKAALYAKGVKEQKEAFAQRWDKLKQEEKQAPTRIKPLFIYAAAAIIALLLLFVFLQPGPQLSNQELAMAYYELPLASSIRGAESDQLFKEGNIAFQQKRYRDAAEAYVGSLEDSSFQWVDDALFYGGVSFMELKEYQKALGLFNGLSTEDYLEMKDWYSALSLLFLDQVEESREILMEIKANPEHHYRSKAVELLEDLGDA